MRGDDAIYHYFRFRGTYNALIDGQLIPKIDTSAIDGFGYSYNLFYGPLSAYVVTLLYFIFRSWAVASNVFIILCIFGSGFFTWLFIRNVSKNKMISFLSAVLYVSSPYLMGDFFMRVAAGEFISFVCLPVLFLGLWKLITKQKFAVLCISISATCVIVSHNISAVTFAMFAIVFLLININKILNWWCIKRLIACAAIIFGLTAFFILPLLEARASGLYPVFDTDFTNNNMGTDDWSLNSERFTIKKILIPDITSGYAQDHFAMTIISIFALIAWPIIFRRVGDKQQRKLVWTLYAFSWFCLIVNSMLINWEYLPQSFKIIQFPWRFLMIFYFCNGIVAGFCLHCIFKPLLNKTFKKAIFVTAIYGLCILFCVHIFGCIYAFVPEQQILDMDSQTSIENGALGWEKEYLPNGHKSHNAILTRNHDIKVLEGNASVSQNYKKNGTHMKFNVENKDSESIIELPLSYYPGFKAQNDDKVSTFCSADGCVSVLIPPEYCGEIELAFQATLITKLAFFITVFCAILTCFIAIFSALKSWN